MTSSVLLIEQANSRSGKAKVIFFVCFFWMVTILSQINYFFLGNRNFVHYSKCWHCISAYKVFTLKYFQLVYIHYKYSNSSKHIFWRTRKKCLECTCLTFLFSKMDHVKALSEETSDEFLTWNIVFHEKKVYTDSIPKLH